MTNVTFLTYNTHLFGTWTGLPGTGWKDKDRFKAFVACLTNPAICSADIVAIQECWSSDFVKSLEKMSEVQAVYPNIYYNLDAGHVSPSNPS